MDRLTRQENSPVQIVVIDDNQGSLALLSSALTRSGVAVHTASAPTQGLALVHSLRPHLVITDLVMPEMSGLDVLQEIVRFDPRIDVILMTAHYTTETAVEAIRRGAADYLQKPVKISLLRERVADLLASAEHRRRMQAAETESFSFEGMTAKSAQMWDLFEVIQRIAPHYRSVLIEGPTGTGKDLVATALHRRSGVTGNYVVLNCSAVVETLFESELFGHARGSFTGADHDKTGLLELANHGTLFLDEIGDMPLSTQAKLLRALQNQEILPVGSLTPRKIDVRVIAATHKDLKAAIADGRFREDLYYRLSMVELTVPPLKERREDVLLLAQMFLRKFNHEFSKEIAGFAPRAAVVLQRYDWPGNVRELEHVIGRAVILTDHQILDVTDFPKSLVDSTDSEKTFERVMPSLAEQERRLVEEALLAAAGNQSEAARRLGIGRDALRYKMKRFNLSG